MLRDRLSGWLLRAGPPEPSPIVLGQGRIFVLPTRAGVGFTSALLVMLIASINYNLGLGFALVFLLGGVGVASMIHAFRNLLHLSVRPGRAAPVFAGETAQFHLLVGNARKGRRPALKLGAPGAGTSFELAGGETIDVALTVPSKRRGWKPLGRVVLETAYPLGLIRAWCVLVPDLDCLVYPAPERDAPPLPRRTANDSGERSRRSGDEDFAGLRRHRPTDSPRHVAWKAVARGGPMLTKEFAGAEGGDVTLDWHALPEDLDVEARLRRLAAWVVAAEAASVAFSLKLPDGRYGPDAGVAHEEACLRRLALFGLPEARHG
ncbi:DUF58 domain-containing protein [Aromatoleum sp.]|uniref:DUF58 domain-containing protein n=1 Tax=Aromatoleum sp. TaxID=2307007 RepID=UPI002FC6B7A8